MSFYKKIISLGSGLSVANIVALFLLNSIVLGVFLAALDHEDGETLGEGLRILSHIDERKTSYIRRRFIHDHLYSEEALVRDAALSAIETLEDFRSIPVLKEYLAWETVGWLKRSAEALLAEFLSYIDEDAIRENTDTTNTHLRLEFPPPTEDYSLTPLRLPITDAVGVPLDPASFALPVLGKPLVLPLDFQE